MSGSVLKTHISEAEGLLKSVSAETVSVWPVPELQNNIESPSRGIPQFLVDSLVERFLETLQTFL